MIAIISGGTQGRSADRGSALAAELTASGTPTEFVNVNMADDDAADRLVGACKARFGTVHGLVNVAAATTRATLFQDTPEHFDRMFTLNVKAPYFLTQAAARLMLETNASGCSIVNVGSTSGHGGQTKLTAYSMSKGALSIMTKNLAYGLMHHGIRVNQVNPGWMDTESEHWTQVHGDGAPPNWLELAEAQRPMGRLVKPWEVANTIAFCLSADSGLMTGNCIDMDQSVQGAGDPPIPSAADAVWP
jgi:NAD(P)-dependent dehydrogenase (short-subunit alcohol dehydrogenase family)